MKIITNGKLVKRYRTFGNISLIVSLVVIGVGFYFLVKENSLLWGAVTMSVSFILSQIGIFFGNRFGVHPQLHEQVSQELKGLDNHFQLFHYTTVVPHLLVGPSGVWILIPVTVKGKISYNSAKNRWNQKGVNLFAKLFMQESLGRPDLEAASAIKDVEKEFKKVYKGQKAPQVNALMFFTNPKVEVSAGNSPIPAFPIRKMKDFIRQKTKANTITEEQLTHLLAFLPQGD